jgi:hypothetical protein
MTRLPGVVRDRIHDSFLPVIEEALDHAGVGSVDAGYSDRDTRDLLRKRGTSPLTLWLACERGLVKVVVTLHPQYRPDLELDLTPWRDVSGVGVNLRHVPDPNRPAQSLWSFTLTVTEPDLTADEEVPEASEAEIFPYLEAFASALLSRTASAPPSPSA